jgi:hypothetical protein
MSSVRAAVPLLKKREFRKIVTTTTVSSSIDSREIPGFLPLYYSYSKPLREVRCLDEGMKEVLVYSRTNTDGPRRPRGSSDEVEVDLAGSHSRLALGTESPLSDPKNS